MTLPINFFLVGAAFVAIIAGVVVTTKSRLFIPLMALGFVFLAAPFVRFWILTRDAYEWTIVVEREIGEVEEPRVIYIQRIEWTTTYERLERQRHHVGSVLLDADTLSKQWKARGYIPIAIRAEILYGSEERTISRHFRDRGPGRYRLTLNFDENDRGFWSIDAIDDPTNHSAVPDSLPVHRLVRLGDHAVRN